MWQFWFDSTLQDESCLQWRSSPYGFARSGRPCGARGMPLIVLALSQLLYTNWYLCLVSLIVDQFIKLISDLFRFQEYQVAPPIFVEHRYGREDLLALVQRVRWVSRDSHFHFPQAEVSEKTGFWTNLLLHSMSITFSFLYFYSDSNLIREFLCNIF